MSRKRRITIQDLGRLPLVKVPDVPRQTLKRFTEEENRHEQEIAAHQKAEADARIKELEKEFNKNLRLLRTERLSTLFTMPSEELAGRVPKTKAAAATKEEFAQKMLAAINKGLAGVDLTPSGKEKLTTVAKVNLHSIDATNPETWRAVYNYMVELNALTPEDGVALQTYSVQPLIQPTVEPKAKPSIDGLSTENREQRLECLRIVGNQWGQEVRDFYIQWAASMRDNWGVDVLTDEMAKRVGSYMVRWNLNPLRHQTYDQIRRAFSKLGYFGEGDYRLDSEKLSDLIEDADLSNRDVRRNIGLRTRELTDK